VRCTGKVEKKKDKVIHKQHSQKEETNNILKKINYGKVINKHIAEFPSSQTFVSYRLLYHIPVALAFLLFSSKAFLGGFYCKKK